METLVEYITSSKLEKESTSVTGTFYYNSVSIHAHKVVDSEEIVVVAESWVKTEPWSDEAGLVAYRHFDNDEEYGEFIEECRSADEYTYLNYNDIKFTERVFDELESVEQETVSSYIDAYDLWDEIED